MFGTKNEGTEESTVATVTVEPQVNPQDRLEQLLKDSKRIERNVVKYEAAAKDAREEHAEVKREIADVAVRLAA